MPEARHPGDESPVLSPPEAPAARRRGRILVVEDNDDVRQMMAVALQSQGHIVEEAADAGQALDRLRAGRFDVVLADYELPDQTGATMLSEASQSGVIGRATALIVTAH